MMNSLHPRLALYGGVFSLVGAVAVLISGYGYQWGFWGLRFAFRYLLFGGSILGMAGFIVSFSAFLPEGILPPRSGFALVGILLGGATITTFSYWYAEAQKYPPIHDITTDTENPPQFQAIVPLRADAPNPTEYGGAEIARIQKEHYPNIETLVLDVPYARAYDMALETARTTSWEIVAESRQEGRIEATHTLPWYGFKDDVVIRVDTTAADSAASRIDARSVSRVGRGDIGVNAHRIRGYLEKLRKRIEG